MALARVAFIAITALPFSAPKAQSFADELKSAIMKGARNVDVQVVIPSSTLTNISKQELRTRMEVALRKHGIPVLRAGIEPPQTLYLTLLVDGYEDSGRVSGYAQLRVLQMVETLTAPRTVTLATTWLAPSVFLDGSYAVLRETIKEYLEESVLGFANDYLRANPPRQP